MNNNEILKKFCLEIIQELEKRFKNACCNNVAEAYLECALLIKKKLEDFLKKNTTF